MPLSENRFPGIVEAMITFNLSATGQKFLAATPDIAAGGAKAMASMQRRVMELVFSKIKEYDEQQKINPDWSFQTELFRSSKPNRLSVTCSAVPGRLYYSV